MIGTTLGHFRISELLGQGGMGAVYRAGDTRLGREVAIKVLPEEFTADSERLARFEREAQVIASLNHPNICALYDVGRTDELHYLVMELVEGESLEARIGRGLEVEQAIAVALQITEALEAAHAGGIVHRDLKPANVMLTAGGPSGVGLVKVLDFGLAKAWGDPEESSPDVSRSPTLTAQMTQAGVILGTAAYMSPEQARGEEADQRADIWSWGVILYEMLVGEQLFAEKTVTDTLAAVLRADFDWVRLPAGTPQRTRTVLHRCLERDQRNRLHSIADARIELTRELPGEDSAPASERRSAKALWVGAAIACLGLVVGALGWMMRTSVGDLPVLVTKVAVGSDLTNAVLSPDGTQVVFDRAGRLYLRELDSMVESEIPGATEVDAGYALFWSPDGRRIGYATPRELYTVGLDGEPPIQVCEIPAWLRYDGSLVGATFWGPDKIVFALDARGLYEVSARGGEPRLLAAPDPAKGERSLHWPSPLPDGKTLLAKVRRRGPDDTITFLRDAKRTDVKFEGWDLERALVSPSGHLVFTRETRDQGIWAAPFSMRELTATGDPVRLVAGEFDDLSLGRGATLLTLSRGGNTSDIVTVDREGSVVGTYDGIAYARDPAVSPDGSRLAFWGVSVHDGERVFDITPERGVGPTWSPDGREIIFEVDNTLWRVDSDGTSEPELVTEDGGDTPHWSSDGKYVAFAAWEQLEGEFSEREIALRWTVQTDIVVLPLKGGEPRVFRGSEHSELNPRFSPDGRFLAYASDRSGQMEIYVATFPEGDRRWKVSDGGGRFPRWSRSGDEIYYASRKALMAAAFDRNGDEVDLGSPIRLFSTLETAVDLWHFGDATYDVTPEGRFVALRAFVYGDDRAAVLVQNWPAMLVPER